ncbi:MAG: phospholipase [Rhodospirillales bacterium]|nr:phospholipase [Rhodospirillales bacterium]
MSDLPQLTGPSSGPAGGRTPRHLILLLHGVGADGNDLIGLAPYFARVLPDAKFVSPNAPFPYDMAPMGYQWFSLQERTEEAMLDGARMARPILDRFIDEQMAALGLGPADTALVGFSQGTMMSLFAGLRRDQPVAGILGYSGRLVGADILADEISVRPPVTLINGDQDELIPASVQPAAVNALKDAGIEVEGHIRPGLGHSIDPVGIELGCEFLARVFADHG